MVNQGNNKLTMLTKCYKNNYNCNRGLNNTIFHHSNRVTSWSMTVPGRGFPTLLVPRSS